MDIEVIYTTDTKKLYHHSSLTLFEISITQANRILQQVNPARNDMLHDDMVILAGIANTANDKLINEIAAKVVTALPATSSPIDYKALAKAVNDDAARRLAS
jgi:hypothetical protein